MGEAKVVMAYYSQKNVKYQEIDQGCVISEELDRSGSI